MIPRILFRLAIGLAACGTLNTAQAAAPNLILIVADDMRHDMLGAAGNRVIHTPNLDALARDGVRFRNTFVTTAICAASRASILTGLYERTHRYTFRNNPIAAKHWNNSYPVLLKRAGYRTGLRR
jgi:alpha-L-rhamnosidase